MVPYKTLPFDLRDEKLTELSRPRVSSIMKKMIDQKVDPGRVAIASGYTTNTRPGPRKERVDDQQ